MSKLWWPTDSNWQKNTQHTCWTEKADRFFMDRVVKLEAGTTEPLSFEKWHDNICGSSSLQHINSLITSVSEDFVRSHVGA